MKIRKTSLPAHSRIAHYRPYDFCDSFSYTACETIPYTPDDFMVAFWTLNPKWLHLLFKIRDTLVRPFGLETGKEGVSEHIEGAIRAGESYRFMSVIEKSANETIIALDDKHLKAFFSVYIEDRKLYLSTLVQYHNRLGVVYFNLIRPFHTIVVKALFRKVLKERGL